MDNKKMKEIRKNIEILPVLQERMDKLNISIDEAEDNVKLLLKKYEGESLDVEKLKKESFSVTILKFIGKYEKKFDKETKEKLAAKIEYDKAFDRVNGLYAEREKLKSRISALIHDKNIYEVELKNREEEILRDVNSEVSIKYRKLEKEQKILVKQIVETDEAIRAADNVKDTADSAMGYLDSAESWSTYDVFADGGILTHMQKYENIDNAQAVLNRLYSQMQDLKKELSDVDINELLQFSGIDSTTRAVDFWFDNIFTDLNVLDRIRDDKEQLERLYDKVNDIICKLENNKRQINNKINDIENMKKKLIEF